VEFLDAQRYFFAPTENMICGDTKGNIAWQASAASPRRPNWHGRLPVPGTGEYEWQGLRSDLPRELNPVRGWIATANHDIHPRGYDPPLFFKNTPQDSRFRRVADVLSRDSAFSMADHMALQHDGYDADGDTTTIWHVRPLGDPLLETLRTELIAWDGQHRRDSRPAAVFRFAERLIGADSVITGRDSAAAQLRVRSVLERSVDSLRRRLGDDPSQWRWGRLNRSEFPHALTRAFDIPPVERHGGSGFVAAVGATYRQVIDINEPDASVATNVPGQSGQPGSPFYQNLVESYGRAEYFPLAYSRAAVERNAAYRLWLVPR
jgi:penicillin amidase